MYENHYVSIIMGHKFRSFYQTILAAIRLRYGGAICPVFFGKPFIYNANHGLTFL